MSKRRVVITGVGPVAPNGTGREAFWEALISGRSGIRQITSFDTSAYSCRVAGQVEDLNPEEYIDPRHVRHMGRFAQLAVVAARLAMRDAGLDEQDAAAATRRGVCLGVSQNAVDILERGFEQFLKAGPRRTSPALTGNAFPHAAAAEISIACRCEGPTSTISAGCASGTAAVGAAREEIRSGRADVMLAGGADGAVTPYVLAAMCATRVLPPHKEGEDPGAVSRPFDGTRRGGVLAEGAGVVVLEELNHAMRRGARIYGEILGYGSNAEAHGMVGFAENDTFLERSMRLALADGRLRPNEVDYICAHGSSDGCDTQETRAIKAVFGEHAYSLAVSSIKSMIGNPLASAGPLQLITVALAFEHQMVPPTTNYRVPDPECDLDYVPNHARVCRVNVALVNSHGFGGANHSIAVARYRDHRRG